MPASRIRFLDVAKGIGILCVVLGHAAIESLGVEPSRSGQLTMEVCFSFHMPLFFLISGYFMHPERDFQWRKESKQLVLTYAVTACAVVVGAGIMAALRHLDVRTMVRFWMDAAWYGSGDVAGNTAWAVQGRIGAIWFLLAMFWARLIVHVCARMPYPGFWVAASFLLGWTTTRSVWLPWSLQSGMCAAAFVYLGILARHHDILGLVRRRPWIWVAALGLWGAAIWKFSGFSMAMNNYGLHPVFAAIGSIAGTLCVIGACQLVDRVNWFGVCLAQAGQATLAILCVHLIEDDVLPWGEWLVTLHAHTIGVPLILVAFAAHLTIDLLGACVLYYVPVVNTWFYPSLERKRTRLVESGV